ncbi:MAG TPA: FecR domain-containing protein [Stellaceae bacterium]|nr:FecR domain-containing protein [Stellaceae bacterium]
MASFRYLRLAACAAPVLLGLAAAGPAAVAQRVGVNSAVNPESTGIPPGAAARRLVIGQDVVYNERITTEAAGQTQILFVDASTMTVGPNSNMVIDQFVYDPNTGAGKFAASLTKGVFRFVGGALSKHDNAVTVRTPTATIGIRGGVMLVNLRPSCRAVQGSGCNELQVIFAYGNGVTVTGLNGISQTITRPGFQVTVATPGATPSPPAPAPQGAATAILSQLDGRPGNNGGAQTVPSDKTVENSGIANANSNNVANAVQAANQNQPVQGRAPSITNAVQQTQANLQLTANQGLPASAPPPSPPPPPPPPPPSVVISYAGLVKTTAGNGANATTQGFLDQTAGLGRIPYTGGTLTFPSGDPAAGVFQATLATAQGPATVQFPLAPGSVSPGFVNFGPAGTASTFGPVTGTSYMSPDSTFFYANLTPVAPAVANERAFIFGGQAVKANSTLLTSAPSGAQPQLYTFALQQDAALRSPVPFVTQTTGGNIPNPSTSPLYVLAPGQSAFGAFSPGANPSATPTRTLQASLAINGNGAGQSSALVVQTGSFFTSSDTGTVAGNGVVRGSFVGNGAAPVLISSGAATVPDGAGNNIFGTGSGSLPISGLVLDQNQYNASASFVPNQVAVQTPVGGSSSNYAFNQPATPTAVTPSTALGSRTTQTLQGSFGGIMYPVVGGKAGAPYAAAGTASVATDATNNQVAATFTGADAFNPKRTALTVQFGGSGNAVQPSSTFVDDTRFAAVENSSTPSQVNGSSTALSSNPTQGTRVALVSSGTVPNNSLLPAGGLCSRCQFLQWGYWTGTLDTPSLGRQDTAHINTWVAGIPSVTLPAVGKGTFSGSALGSVVNGGKNYLAAGSFTNTYDFGARLGSFVINNFDTRNFTGTVKGNVSGNGYAGKLTGPKGFTGTAAGAFFGNIPGFPASETGGSFALKGPAYLASGVFAGAR